MHVGPAQGFISLLVPLNDAFLRCACHPVAASSDGAFENRLGFALDAKIDGGLSLIQQLGQPQGEIENRVYLLSSWHILIVIVSLQIPVDVRRFQLKFTV
jgi:hypothetical protein